MRDLVLASLGLATVSLVALIGGVRLACVATRSRVNAVATVGVALLLWYVLRYHGTWQMARLLPFSSAIVLGNWIPIGGAFFAGLTLGESAIPGWRRLGWAALILIACVYSVACCFLGHVSERELSAGNAHFGQQNWRSSCGASCAAVLLQLHGIEATEGELVKLCLTSHRGTPALGVYRGLKIKTAGSRWDVEIVTCPLDELLAMEGPLLLRDQIPEARLLDGTKDGKRMGRRLEHAVLLLDGRDPDHIRILDPASGIRYPVRWTIEDLRERWRGEALRLVRRAEEGATGGGKSWNNGKMEDWNGGRER